VELLDPNVTCSHVIEALNRKHLVTQSPAQRMQPTSLHEFFSQSQRYFHSLVQIKQKFLVRWACTLAAMMQRAYSMQYTPLKFSLFDRPLVKSCINDDVLVIQWWFIVVGIQGPLALAWGRKFRAQSVSPVRMMCSRDRSFTSNSPFFQNGFEFLTPGEFRWKDRFIEPRGYEGASLESFRQIGCSEELNKSGRLEQANVYN
jgi:hypothetical protein